MSIILTKNSQIRCAHGGIVNFPPSANKLTVSSFSVLTPGELLSATIMGCPQTGPGVSSCLQIVQITGGTTKKMTLAGQPVLTGELRGVTNGSPPGQLVVISPGQGKFESI